MYQILPIFHGYPTSLYSLVMPTNAIEANPLDRHECNACGYVYEPTVGDKGHGVAAGTPFLDLPATWKCPVCGASQARFSNLGVKGSASGFKQNLNYGFGVNRMTSGQKSALIFGGLALFFLLFLSLYGLQ